MTEREKMLSGELYDPTDKELEQLRLNARKLARKYNSTDEDDQEMNIVFFCHLGVMLAIMGHLMGVSPTVLWHGFFVAPTSVTVLGSEEMNKGEAYFRCQVLGDTRHLYEGNEPVSQSGYFTKPFQG